MILICFLAFVTISESLPNPGSVVRIRAVVPKGEYLRFGQFLHGKPEANGTLVFCRNCSTVNPKCENWILLTPMYSKHFSSIIRVAHDKNASGIIFMSDRHFRNSDLIQNFSERRILDQSFLKEVSYLSIVMIDKRTGRDMINLLKFHPNLPVFTSVLPPAREVPACVAVFTVIMIFFTILAVIFSSVSSPVRHRTELPINDCRFNSFVEKIPSHELTDPEDPFFNDDNNCAICLEKFSIPDVVSILPCNHTYHKCCIEEWLNERRLCPMCKMDVVKFYGYINLGSEESIVDLPLDEEITNNQDDNE